MDLQWQALPKAGFLSRCCRKRRVCRKRRDACVQAAAVLALAERDGVETSADRRPRRLSALRLEVKRCWRRRFRRMDLQADDGGWGDEKNAPASLQITAVAVMALSSARDVGVAVPAAAFDQARRFILACKVTPAGGFGEQPGKPPSVDATAAALLALDVLSPGGDGYGCVAATAEGYLDSQTAAAADRWGFTADAWVCWCDARLELPATVKIFEMLTFRDWSGRPG